MLRGNKSICGVLGELVLTLFVWYFPNFFFCHSFVAYSPDDSIKVYILFDCVYLFRLLSSFVCFLWVFSLLFFQTAIKENSSAFEMIKSFVLLFLYKILCVWLMFILFAILFVFYFLPSSYSSFSSFHFIRFSVSFESSMWLCVSLLFDLIWLFVLMFWKVQQILFLPFLGVCVCVFTRLCGFTVDKIRPNWDMNKEAKATKQVIKQ